MRATQKEILCALANPAEFKRLVTCNFFLLNIAAQSLEYAETLIQILLKDPDLFDRLIKDDGGLTAIKPYCPHIPVIQNANTFQEARNAVKKEMLEKNREATFMQLTQLRRNGFFTSKFTNYFPDELVEKILDDLAPKPKDR